MNLAIKIQNTYGKYYNFDKLYLNAPSNKLPKWAMNVITANVWNGCSSNSGSTARFAFGDNITIRDLQFMYPCLRECGLILAAALIENYIPLKAEYIHKEMEYGEHMNNCDNEDCAKCIEGEEYLEGYIDSLGESELSESEDEVDAIIGKYIAVNNTNI